ncbi:MAG: FtsQ-type POTRA domain-containing protein [Desulfovibrionaceae bacterium]|nr:FtsQ-type POTRA domain-containing protein [Desulfovibrionaceae bacterium]
MSTFTLERQNRLKFLPAKGNRYKRPGGPGLSAPRGLVPAFKGLFAGALGLALLACLGVGLLYSYRWMTINPYFGLKEVEVAGLDRLAYGDVVREAGLRLGQNCLALNVSDIESSLIKNPWVKSVAVRRDLPGRLSITVTERRPAFWVLRGSNLFYADDEGVLIAAVGPGRFSSLPVLEVHPDAPGKAAAVNRVVSLARRTDLPFPLDAAAWIRVDSNGDLEMFLDNRGLTVRLDPGDWERGLTHLAAVWKDLEARDELALVSAMAARGDKVWVKRKG